MNRFEKGISSAPTIVQTENWIAVRVLGFMLDSFQKDPELVAYLRIVAWWNHMNAALVISIRVC